MAKWNQTLDLTPEWGLAEDGKITLQEMAMVAAQRLVHLKDVEGTSDIDSVREELINEFNEFVDMDEEDYSAFNDIMVRLYDWGDRKLSGDFFDAVKNCWIKTIF